MEFARDVFLQISSSVVSRRFLRGAILGFLVMVAHEVYQKRHTLLLKPLSLGANTFYLTKAESKVASNLVKAEDITTSFEVVGGLQEAKKILLQHVVWPFKNSSLLPPNSIRSHPKGVLLFGPPGTGKTLLARALAKELGCSFINVKVDALFSKWVGETEKLTAAVFSLARKVHPTVIFIDEIDSVLSARSDSDAAVVAHSKAIFMTEWDGLEKGDEQIVVIGATNRRFSIDEAILRRLPLKIEVPLPSCEVRQDILHVLLSHDLVEGPSKDAIVTSVAKATDSFSGADLEELCKAAALISMQDMNQEEGNPRLSDITEEHFKVALRRMKGCTSGR